MATESSVALAGVHHFKFPVTDLDRSLRFYADLFGAKPIPELEHRHKGTSHLYAHICEVPELGTKLELRLNAEQAEKQRQFDPVTIAVTDRDMLRRWTARLDERGIAHSGVIVAIRAWLVAFDDPDAHRLRFYTLEKHGPELPPDEGNDSQRLGSRTFCGVLLHTPGSVRASPKCAAEHCAIRKAAWCPTPFREQKPNRQRMT